MGSFEGDASVLGVKCSTIFEVALSVDGGMDGSQDMTRSHFVGRATPCSLQVLMDSDKRKGGSSWRKGAGDH